ncbi:RluA family pseudouridine synthase [Tenacibaculum mesophilum]|uniref:RluA family pseudouridine synthase n=1 Tax=Tenacibaculum mesophilum TaxID=104268 RepID=A0AAE9MKQ7_9FLAO|nr:RluA family pseudouridine synthase [Tenacibaculum mesophilum]KAF9658095.1 RluA family pseudouridine synthase [Tenacibaculum mesophilum]UTD14666.1 RluA family pseudouridine synthase [Tenacibaculum mesophilum]GFD92746.1 pseudouridine synthase [Alteromonas sp. KUL154]GFE00765.1 pseudouridine synthase [Alteromonas sp. KUL156]
MNVSENHNVKKIITPTRLQEYAIGVFKTIPTKSGIKKAIKKGLVKVNGKTASTALYIKGGETIELLLPKENLQKKHFNFPLEVLFEDNYLAIIYKPSGVLVSGNSFATIDNALTQNLQKSTLFDTTRPRPVHRLDHPTSGLLLIGKTTESIIVLNQLFQKKEIQKIYHAICIGKIERKGEINFPIDDKKASTSFEVIETAESPRFDFLNLVKLHPKTGRKHQLRKHLFAIGNPILGDKEYFIENKILKGKGLFLHASTLEFTHPFTKETINITKELPKKFKKIFP